MKVTDGYLKYLEINNFKSYKGTQKIGPFKKFSCIIGPNGSGKSNLVDAISFVLGVNASHLRGSQLKDLIFRVEGESSKVDSAYVKLVYSTEYGEETEFMRNITQNDSSFSINGEELSWEQYNEQLSNLNIIVKAKNFLVFQGDVESIATKSPKALTELFEEISGSIEYKSQYDKLLAKKEQAEENTRFNERKRKGINAEKIQFDQQMTEAEKYEKLVKKKKTLTLDYMLFQLYHINKDLRKHDKVLLSHKNKLSDLQSERLKLNQSLSTKKKSQTKYRKESLKIEQQIRKLKRQINKNQPELISTKEEIEFIKKRIESLSRSHQDKEHNIEQHEELLNELQKKLDEIKQEQISFEENMKLEEAEDIQLSPENLKEYNEKKAQLAKVISKESTELEQINRLQKLDIQSKESHLTQQEEYNERINQLNERIEQLVERETRVKDLQDNCLQKKNDLELQLTDSRKQTKVAEKKKDVLAKKIEEIQSELRERKADIRESKRDQKFKELLKNLTRLFPSVRGRLIDLIEPRERYQLAVTVSLGKNMDAIIVDDEKTAIECLNYMKEQRIGTATFIPLDTIKVRPINEQLRHIDDSVKLVMDVMKYDHSFKKAIQYACGNTVVCENIEDAKKIAFGKVKKIPNTKVVTIDGVIIRKSGLITGGVSNSLVSRARGWEQKDIQILKDKRDNFINELAEIGRTLRLKNKEEIIINQISGIETRISFVEKDLSITKDKIKDTQEDINNIKDKLLDIEPLIESLENKIEERNTKIEDLELVITREENKIFGDFADRMGMDDVHEYEEKHLKLAKEKTQKRMEFSNIISKLENQLEYEKSRNFEDSLSIEEEKMKDDKNSLNVLQKKFVTLKKTQDTIEKQISKYDKSLSSIKTKINNMDSEVNDLKSQIDELIQKMGQVQKQFATAEGIIDQCRVKRHNIYQTCKVEEIWDMMPIEDNEEEDEEEDDDPMDMDTDSQQFDKEDNIILNFRKLSNQYKQSNNYEKYVQDFKNQLHSVSITIDEIDPNLKASVHLKRVKERLGKTKGDLNDARTASDLATKKFKSIQKKRIEKFNASYKPIANEIDNIYKTLTSGGGGKPGGTAYLNVDNIQEPYLGGVRFHVMPPNKRFRDMEQLSGGEKTVAALALLFAMHSIHPAPFFLLDEVDAALDKSNIAKVARYLQSRKLDIQFIVVSLQDRFYENSDSLIGVMFDQNQKCSSTLSLDLQQYT